MKYEPITNRPNYKHEKNGPIRIEENIFDRNREFRNKNTILASDWPELKLILDSDWII